MPNRQERKINHWKADKADRQKKKEIKANRKTSRPRIENWKNKDWRNLDEWDAEAISSVERIMPSGERRQWENGRVIKEFGIGKDIQTVNIKNQNNVSGLVVSVSAGSCLVEFKGRQLLCSFRGSLSAVDTGFTNLVAVGDRVVVSKDGHERGVVEEVLPRQSALVRPDVYYDHLKQVIVANADQLLVVASWRSPKIWFELIDRMLIAAESNHLQPIICVNKIDLAKDLAEVQDDLAYYRDLGYQTLFTSALHGEGINRLGEVLKGRTTILAGLSGVGKSSLLNKIQPGLDLRVSEISAARNEGRHTTSQTNLMRLDGGGYIVDTPGIKEFGLCGVSKTELADYYPEFVPLNARCRFKNCSHIQEPDCAVQQAVNEGIIPQFRFDNYCKIFLDLD